MPSNFERFALVRGVCDAAWSIMTRDSPLPSARAAEEAQLTMVGRVTSAVVAGQRDYSVPLAVALVDD